ncbi:MAG: iron-sulfur cluster assembly scaffold protein [Planctomycetaceae bacterium]
MNGGGNVDENPLLEHTNAPYHRGTLEKATHTGYLRNPTCGDEVTIQLQISGDMIRAAWFMAAGCLVSQAAASILCEAVEGRSLAEASAFTPQEFLHTVNTPLTPHRQICALLPYRAFVQALEQSSPQRDVAGN